MKVLHISLKPLYPKVDGGCVAMDNFLKLLTDVHEHVEHLCIATPKHPFQKEEYQQQLPSTIKLVTPIFIDTSINFFRLFFSLFSKRSYQIDRFYSKELSEFLKTNAKQYSAIYLESVFLLSYVKDIDKSTKVFIRTHNIEHKIWETKQNNTGNYLKKLVFKRFSQQIKELELTALNRANGLIHISETDAIYFKEKIPQIPQVTIPLTVSTTSIIDGNTCFNINKLGFLGAANWAPNTEAIHLLVNEIFPAIQKENEFARLTIAGYGTEQLGIKKTYVQVKGAVGEVFEFFEEIGVFLAPLQSGSGLKIKMVEAICHGKVVIGSPIAFEGLEFLPHKRIAKLPEDYVTLLRDLKENKQIKEEVKAQQIVILEHFGKNNLIKKLADFVQ